MFSHVHFASFFPPLFFSFLFLFSCYSRSPGNFGVDNGRFQRGVAEDPAVNGSTFPPLQVPMLLPTARAPACPARCAGWSICGVRFHSTVYSVPTIPPSLLPSLAIHTYLPSLPGCLGTYTCLPACLQDSFPPSLARRNSTYREGHISQASLLV